MGVSGNALEIAVSYSSTIFAGATLIWLFNLLMAVVRGTGNLQVPVIVVCGGALILVPLSPALIFGAFGYQGLGPSGGAVAMLVYYAFGTLAYAAYLWGRFGVLKPSFRLPKFSLGPALAILRVGGMSAIVSGPSLDFLGSAMFFIASDRGPDEWEPLSSQDCSGPPSRCSEDFVVVWLKADVTWNFVAVALGMVAFGLFALPPLVSRSGYE